MLPAHAGVHAVVDMQDLAKSSLMSASFVWRPACNRRTPRLRVAVTSTDPNSPACPTCPGRHAVVPAALHRHRHGAVCEHDPLRLAGLSLDTSVCLCVHARVSLRVRVGARLCGEHARVSVRATFSAADFEHIGSPFYLAPCKYVGACVVRVCTSGHFSGVPSIHRDVCRVRQKGAQLLEYGP